MTKEKTLNLQTKLIEKLVNKKLEYWKERFIERLKEELHNKGYTENVWAIIDKLSKEEFDLK